MSDRMTTTASPTADHWAVIDLHRQVMACPAHALTRQPGEAWPECVCPLRTLLRPDEVASRAWEAHTNDN